MEAALASVFLAPRFPLRPFPIIRSRLSAAFAGSLVVAGLPQPATYWLHPLAGSDDPAWPVSSPLVFLGQRCAAFSCTLADSSSQCRTSKKRHSLGTNVLFWPNVTCFFHSTGQRGHCSQKSAERKKSLFPCMEARV